MVRTLSRVGMFTVAILAASGGAWAAGPPSPGASVVTGNAVVDTTRLTRREGHPRIFLSWDAPYGMQRARDAITVSCDDSTAADTLYLTLDPGEDLAHMTAIDATLTFRAPPGDSLGAFWDLSRSGANPWNLRIEFDEPPDGVRSPWPVAGMGAPRYKLTKDAGQLDLTYFVAASKSGPVFAGSRYFIARVMLRLRKPYLGGCRQPVCVELGHVLVSYTGGTRWITDGERFVSWNSPGGAACAQARLKPVDKEPERFGGRVVPPTPPAPADSTHK